MSEFKIGDKVYVPYYGTGIFIVSTNSYNEDLDIYPFMVGAQTFTVHGKSDDYGPLQEIFHATPENHAALEQLYGVEFEAPPVKPTSREIVRAMLKRGDKYVCCWLSDVAQEPDCTHFCDFVVRLNNDSAYLYKTIEASWKYATPFDHTTGKAITELPT